MNFNIYLYHIHYNLINNFKFYLNTYVIKLVLYFYILLIISKLFNKLQDTYEY